jgi:CTP-dependent riboflavin kinase
MLTMAEENLRKYFGLKDGDHVHVEVWVEADG